MKFTNSGPALFKPETFPTDNMGATTSPTASTAFVLGARSTHQEPIPQLCYSVTVPVVLRGFSICSGAETPVGVSYCEYTDSTRLGFNCLQSELLRINCLHLLSSTSKELKGDNLRHRKWKWLATEKAHEEGLKGNVTKWCKNASGSFVFIFQKLIITRGRSFL